MARPNPSQAPPQSRAARALALAALLLCCAAPSLAQSGRKAQKPLGLPTEAAPKQGEPAKAEVKKPDALVSFIVMRSDDANFIDPVAQEGAAAAFLRRLGQSQVVDVTGGGKGRRQEARARAKEEKKAYVVVFQLEEQPGELSVSRADSRGLVLRTFVYAPVTGDLKFTDTTWQRPYNESARIGGVRVPVPARRPERYPSQLELEQAGRDAADRLLARFQITPPRDNE